MKQIQAWVDGKPYHDGDKVNGECCPDFSCCCQEIITPKEEKELFAELYIDEDHEGYERMLIMFLGRAMPHMTNKDVYIAGT